MVVEVELLGDVWDRPADEAEADPVRAVELDRLHSRGDQAAADRGAVRGEHEVGAAFEDADLVGQGPRGSAQVGLGDDVEDDLAGRGDVDLPGIERAGPAADAQVERDGTSDQSEVSADSRGYGGEGGHDQPLDPSAHDDQPPL